MKPILKVRLKDWLLTVLMIYVLISDILWLSTLSPVTLIFGLPFLALSIIFFQFAKYSIVPCAIIFDKGIKIKNRYFSWNEIKSISFSSGRYKDTRFWADFKLPAVQRIYVLDKDGKEYNSVIDIDHTLKSDRHNNNILKINNMLHLLGKNGLISDWAEKR